jgi:hypothetical protein
MLRSMAERTDFAGAQADSERLLTSMNADFERLRNDRYEWESFKAEMAAWDEVGLDLDRGRPDPAPPR